VTEPPAGGEVHVWWLERGDDAWPVDATAGVLSSEERDRAARFLAAEARERFAAGRVLARNVLGAYLRIAPVAVEFAYTTTGKPLLGGAHAGRGLHFSLSHAGDVAILGVGSAGPIGIDVEHMRPGRFAPTLIARVFTAAERQAIAASPDPEAACYRLWVRKEACIKASWEGIAAGLLSLDVLGTRCLDTRNPAPGREGWRIADVPMQGSYVAAIAVAGNEPAPVVRKWR
jgi:4'-phosphopantetheinyl transferase